MRKCLLVIMVVNVFFSDAVAQKKIKNTHSKVKTASPSEKGIIKYGTASFYAKKFDGRQTANGEIYRSKKYSAACNVLPLNTWIKVTNLKNDKSLVVKVNDRLASKNKRLVDLSRIAAHDLGYVGRGLTKVKIEVIKNFKLSNDKVLR